MRFVRINCASLRPARNLLAHRRPQPVVAIGFPLDMSKRVMVALAALAACAEPGRIVVRGPADGEELPACHVAGQLRAEYFAPVVAYARRHLIQRVNAPDPEHDGFAYLIEPGSPEPDHDGLSFIVDARSETGALAVLQKRGAWRRETRYALHLVHSGPLTTVVIFVCQPSSAATVSRRVPT